MCVFCWLYLHLIFWATSHIGWRTPLPPFFSSFKGILELKTQGKDPQLCLFLCLVRTQVRLCSVHYASVTPNSCTRQLQKPLWQLPMEDRTRMDLACSPLHKVGPIHERTLICLFIPGTNERCHVKLNLKSRIFSGRARSTSPDCSWRSNNQAKDKRANRKQRS